MHDLKFDYKPKLALRPFLKLSTGQDTDIWHIILSWARAWDLDFLSADWPLGQLDP